MSKKDFTNRIGATRTNQNKKDVSASTLRLFSKENLQSLASDVLKEKEQQEQEAPREEIKQQAQPKPDPKPEAKPKAPSTATKGKRNGKEISVRIKEELYIKVMEDYKNSTYKKFIDYIENALENNLKK